MSLVPAFDILKSIPVKSMYIFSSIHRYYGSDMVCWGRYREQTRRASSVYLKNVEDAGSSEIQLYSRLVRSCCKAKDLAEGRRLHARILASKHLQVRYLANLLVDMYGKCGSVNEASMVFHAIQQPNLFSWTLMVAAFAHNGHLEEAKDLFDRMLQRDAVSWTTMVAAYAQHGQLQRASNMFAKMPKLDIVSWNAMLAAYAQNGHLQDAKSTFDRMPRRNVVTGNTMVGAYGQNGQLEQARSVFARMPELDVISWTAIVTAYAQNGHLEEARGLFETMPERNLLSWTTMIIACGQHGDIREAKSIFDRMPGSDLVAWNVMIQAYAQNGHLVEARSAFERFVQRDAVTWNVMIQAHAQNGDGKSGLELFARMCLEGVNPDEITFIGVLNACSHVGLLDESRSFFHSMAGGGIKPTIEHYFCMVDILGRAGRLSAAEDLLNSMPYLPDAVAWLTLLGACRIHVDLERAARAAKHFSELNPESVSPYVLLTSMYAVPGEGNL